MGCCRPCRLAALRIVLLASSERVTLSGQSARLPHQCCLFTPRCLLWGRLSKQRLRLHLALTGCWLVSTPPQQPLCIVFIMRRGDTVKHFRSSHSPGLFLSYSRQVAGWGNARGLGPDRLIIPIGMWSALRSHGVFHSASC